MAAETSENNLPLTGAILVNKPKNLTSHDIVDKARKILQTKQIGHTGTLDPFAEGLLILLIGEAARLQGILMAREKTYEAHISFGTETDTCDPLGKTIHTCEGDISKILSRSEIEDVITKDFTGEIEQKPPAFSAIHINGKRAYELARAGEIVDMPSRKVNISDFKILSHKDTELLARITVSSGTYIRSIARDLGIKLGCYAHLKALKRISIGDFSLTNACEYEQIVPEKLVPVEELIKHNHTITIEAKGDLDLLKNGNYVKWQQYLPQEKVTIITFKDVPILILKNENGKIKAVYNYLKYIRQ